MFANLVSLLTALVQIVIYFRNKYGDNWGNYVRDMGGTFKLLNEAKTTDEKQKAAYELAKLAARWGQE